MPQLDRATGNIAEHLPSDRSHRPGVLVVEDEPLARIAVCDYLQDCDFKVFDAGSALDAIRFLESCKSDVQVVFTDIQLGNGPTGVALANWVKAYCPEIRVLLTSGDSASLEEARTDDCPVVPKPYDYDDLVEKLRALSGTPDET